MLSTSLLWVGGVIPGGAEKAKVIQEQSISALWRDGISSLEIFPSLTVRWRVLVLLVLLLLKEGLINSGELPASTSFCPTKATPRWFICPCFQRPQLPIQQPLVFLVLHPTREIIIQTIQLIKSHTSQDARRLQQMGMPSSLNFPPGSPPPTDPLYNRTRWSSATTPTLKSTPMSTKSLSSARSSSKSIKSASSARPRSSRTSTSESSTTPSSSASRT